MRVKHYAEKDGFKMIDLIFAGKGCEVWARLVTPKPSPGICECLSERYSAPVSTSQSTCIKTIWKRKLKWLFIFHALPHTPHICLQIWAGAQIANFVWLSRVMIFYGRPLSQIYVTVHAVVICDQICATYLCKDEPRNCKAGMLSLKLT